VPVGGHGLPLPAGVLLIRKPCVLGVARARQRPTTVPWAGRGVLVTIDPSAPLWRPVRYRGLRSARVFNSATCWQGATPIAAGRANAAAADPSRIAATDGGAIQRIRGPGAQARQAAGRAQIIPFEGAAGHQPPTGTLAPNGGSVRGYSAGLAWSAARHYPLSARRMINRLVCLCAVSLEVNARSCRIPRVSGRAVWASGAIDRTSARWRRSKHSCGDQSTHGIG
jgi:hypothetical protein